MITSVFTKSEAGWSIHISTPTLTPSLTLTPTLPSNPIPYQSVPRSHFQEHSLIPYPPSPFPEPELLKSDAAPHLTVVTPPQTQELLRTLLEACRKRRRHEDALFIVHLLKDTKVR